MAVIRKFLDLSTAHLAQADEAYLETCAASDGYGLPAYRTGCGWSVHAPDDLEGYTDKNLPPHMRRMCEHAREQDCDYVLFDAARDPALPTFDEETGAETTEATPAGEGATIPPAS